MVLIDRRKLNTEDEYTKYTSAMIVNYDNYFTKYGLDIFILIMYICKYGRDQMYNLIIGIIYVYW